MKILKLFGCFIFYLSYLRDKIILILLSGGYSAKNVKYVQ